MCGCCIPQVTRHAGQPCGIRTIARRIVTTRRQRVNTPRLGRLGCVIPRADEHPVCFSRLRCRSSRPGCAETQRDLAYARPHTIEGALRRPHTLLVAWRAGCPRGHRRSVTHRDPAGVSNPGCSPRGVSKRTGRSSTGRRSHAPTTVSGIPEFWTPAPTLDDHAIK